MWCPAKALYKQFRRSLFQRAIQLDLYLYVLDSCILVNFISILLVFLNNCGSMCIGICGSNKAYMQNLNPHKDWIPYYWPETN